MRDGTIPAINSCAGSIILIPGFDCDSLTLGLQNLEIQVIAGERQVVGGADKGGILVRAGQGTGSEQLAERLSTGATVEELNSGAFLWLLVGFLGLVFSLLFPPIFFFFWGLFLLLHIYICISLFSGFWGRLFELCFFLLGAFFCFCGAVCLILFRSLFFLLGDFVCFCGAFV